MRDLHPIEALLLIGLLLAAAVLTVLRLLALPALALTLALLQPRRRAVPVPPVALPCAPPPAAVPMPPLEALTVADLRRLARAAGLPRCLSHRGRRADLLAALAACPLAA